MPRGPPPARSPELPAPGSARQRPRGQCGAGGGLRGGDCLRLAREPKVGHGRPAERWQVSGGGRRPHPAPPAPRPPRSSRRRRARPPRPLAWRDRWRQEAPARLCSCGRRRRGGPGAGRAAPPQSPRQRGGGDPCGPGPGARRLPCAAAGPPPAPGGRERRLGEWAGAARASPVSDRGAAPGLPGLWVLVTARQETAPKAACCWENAGKERHAEQRAGKGSHLDPGPCGLEQHGELDRFCGMLHIVLIMQGRGLSRLVETCLNF